MLQRNTTIEIQLQSDLLLAADIGQVSALCLLDLKAASDTVDHDLLMLRLERQVLYSSGSDHIFQTGLSELCLVPVLHF